MFKKIFNPIDINYLKEKFIKIYHILFIELNGFEVMFWTLKRP